MSVTLRIATPGDAAAIHEVYEFYIHHSVATFNEVGRSVEYHRAFIEETLKTYPYLVAEDDGRFVGFANAEPVRPQTGYRYCVELTIYLHPDAPKHSGTGTLLYSRLLEILTGQGFRIAYGVISGTNGESIGLHRRLGFEEVARFRQSGYKHGMWLDAVWMQKTLNPFDKTPALPIPFSEYRKGLGAFGEG